MKTYYIHFGEKACYALFPNTERYLDTTGYTMFIFDNIDEMLGCVEEDAMTLFIIDEIETSIEEF